MDKDAYNCAVFVLELENSLNEFTIRNEEILNKKQKVNVLTKKKLDKFDLPKAGGSYGRG